MQLIWSKASPVTRGMFCAMSMSATPSPSRSPKRTLRPAPNNGVSNFFQSFGCGFDARTEQVTFSEQKAFVLPEGSVLAQHLEIPLDERNPERTLPLETRVLVVKADGDVYGLSYRWREDGSDADLVTQAAEREIAVLSEKRTEEKRTWSFPGRGDCLRCHSPNVGSLLGLSARQLLRLHEPRGH